MNTDQSLKLLVINKLADCGLGFPCEIVVKATKGVVTLSGSVRQARQIARVVRLTSGIWGVQQIVDLLVVKAPVNEVVVLEAAP